MIWNLDISLLLGAVTIVTIVAFFLGYMLDGVMGSDGFGAVGNTVIITAGFFIGVLTYNNYGFAIADIREGTVVGLVGSFIALAGLGVGKGALNRL